MTRRPSRRPRAVGRRTARLAPPTLAALVGGFAVIGGGDAPAQDGVAGVDGVRAALEQMVETRRVISRERQEWELGRELLQARIEVVRDRIEDLRGRIATTEESIDEADRRREELLAENEELKAASASLAEMAATLEARTAELLARLPEPLQARVRTLSQQFPEDPADTDLALSVRFQNVVGVLNEVNKFNREITVTSERRIVGGGRTEVEVAAMYVGVAYGYYASIDGRFAGRGTAEDGAWTWVDEDAASEAIRRAIAILENEAVADFVQLPMTVD